VFFMASGGCELSGTSVFVVIHDKVFVSLG